METDMLLRRCDRRPALALLAAALLITLIGGCATEDAAEVPPEPPPEVARAPHDDPGRVHVIEHDPGTCRLCDLYLAARTWVVQIQSEASLGAGVVLSEDGLLVTNAHVVGPADSVIVTLSDGRVVMAHVVSRDTDQDLALLRAAGPMRWSPPQIEAGVLPPVGSEIYVIGHPIGLGWTITRGIVSAYREIDGVRMIQTDAAISPGNSGGAMLDEHGHLIGVVTSKISGPTVENVAFARPTSTLLEMMERAGFLDG